MQESKLLGLTPDWWMVAATVTLTVATVVLGAFTALLWKATQTAVRETSEGLRIARDTASAARQQAEVAERVGMIQNINALQGHLRYIASCALYNCRPSEEALGRIAGSEKGFGRLLQRLEWGPAGDLGIETKNRDDSHHLKEATWVHLIISPHLDDFFDAACGIVDIARTAKVAFLVDQRIVRALAFRDRIPGLQDEVRSLGSRAAR